MTRRMKPACWPMISSARIWRVNFYKSQGSYIYAFGMIFSMSKSLGFLWSASS